jgi:uncharacterized protein DUF2242
MLRNRLPLLACALLAACSTPAPVHQVERFDPQSPYQHFFRTTPEATCEAARRALLSQGYVIDPAKPDSLQATKYFQPDIEHSTTLQVSLVCVKAGGGAVAYANAREQRYALKAGGNSAGLSVAGLGSISLPWGANNENLVKVGEATIADPDFYTRFFGLVDFEFVE